MPHYWRPIPVGVGDVSFRLRMVGDPDPIVNTMAFDFPTEPTIGNANTLFSAYATRIMPLMSSLITFEGVHVLYQSDSANQTVVDSSSAAVVGTSAAGSAVLPLNCAYLIRKKTAYAGRRMRGRWYHPCPSESSVDAVGAVLPATVGLLQTPYGSFLADIGTFVPVLLHSVKCTNGDSGHDGPHSATPLPPTPITQLEVDDHIASQRRRMNR